VKSKIICPLISDTDFLTRFYRQLFVPIAILIVLMFVDVDTSNNKCKSLFWPFTVEINCLSGMKIVDLNLKNNSLSQVTIFKTKYQVSRPNI
jgi:hypothetical protein